MAGRKSTVSALVCRTTSKASSVVTYNAGLVSLISERSASQRRKSSTEAVACQDKSVACIGGLRVVDVGSQLLCDGLPGFQESLVGFAVTA